MVVSGKCIQIVGAGTAGCLTAIYLAKNLPEYQIVWTYPEKNTPIGVGEGSTPELIKFLSSVGITYNDLRDNCDATIKLAIKFIGWKGPEHVYYHPFGAEYNDTCMLNHACVNNSVPMDILSNDSNYSVHFNAFKLQQLIISKVKTLSNVTIVNTDYDMNNESDVIVDCTGFTRAIMNNLVRNDFKEYDDINCNNRAYVTRIQYTNKQDQMVPYTIAKASTVNGWYWMIPTRDYMGLGYVHSTKHDSDVAGFMNFVKEYTGTPAGELREVNFRTGRYKKHAVYHDDKLYCSVGLGSCFIEPLEATGLYLTIRSINLLVDLITCTITQEYYNNDINANYDSCVEYIQLHYMYSKSQAPYWRSFDAIDVSKSKYDKLHMQWIRRALSHDDLKRYLIINDKKLPGDVTNDQMVDYSKWLELYDEQKI